MVAHEGFSSPVTVNNILLASGHSPVALTRTQVEGGALLAGNYDVFVIGRNTTYWGASAAYVQGVADYISAGGNIVTEYASAGMFFSSYVRPVVISTTLTQQLRLFGGGFHAGYFHQGSTPIDLLDPAHPVTAGLPDPFAEFNGTDYFFWFDTADPNLTILGTFIGNGANGFPRGASLPCLAAGCFGVSRFVFGTWNWNDTLGLSNGRNRAFFLKAVNFAAEGCNLLPLCNAGGPYVAECQGNFAAVALDATGSSDPEGGALTFSWTSDCPGAAFDDPASPAPVLTVDASLGCSTSCSVTLAVSDGRDTVTGSASVTIQDTMPPAVSCAASPTGAKNQVAVSFSASDLCSAAQVSAVIDLGCEQVPVADGQALDLCADFICRLIAVDTGALIEERRDGTLVVTATDACGNTSTCSVLIPKPAPEDCIVMVEEPGMPFIRGDANGNQRVGVGDVFHILRFVHHHGPGPACRDAADVNDDGALDGLDAMALIHCLFLGDRQIPLPFPQAGRDPTPDDLTCDQYPSHPNKERKEKPKKEKVRKEKVKKEKKKCKKR
ncbi:MAG: hypothetical protein HY717_11865 [Planctomycetes bacterium]|nr:hypothetical protein [Planctomycetota bacterium]